MAVRYLRSTDGSDGDSGATWALAKATLGGLAAIDTAGDSLYVSQSHAESAAGIINVSFAGTLGSPTRLLCANDGAEPPTALATTGTITGDGTITLQGAAAFYGYGLSFTAGIGGNFTQNITSTMSGAVFESCNFILNNIGASSQINLTGTTSARAINCGFKFGNAAQSLRHDEGLLHIKGGSILSGGTSPTTFLTPAARSDFLVEGFDFSNAAAGLNLVAATAASVKGTFRNCKLPATWSGVLHSSTPGYGSTYELFNCDSGDTNYRYRKAAQFGTVADETTIVRTGGASDGTTTWSLKMVTNANALYPTNSLSIPERVRWNTTVGTPITVTVEFVHDSLTALKDNEIWLEVEYLGTSGFPLSTHISDAANVLATAADQADSSEVWTTTGLTNPNTRKLSVTFTPQEVGYIHYTVRLAKASTTVYVDPKATVA